VEKVPIIQGSTLRFPVRWGTTPIVYKPITGVVLSAPLRFTVVGHGLPDGWRVEVVSVRGSTTLNSSGKGKPTDYHLATVVDADTVELNDVNLDDLSPYEGGGYLKFSTPVNLAGYDARMKFKDRVGGVELFSLSSEVGGGLTIDVDNFVTLVELSALQTKMITLRKVVADLEMVKGTDVDNIVTISFPVQKEITTG